MLHPRSFVGLLIPFAMLACGKSGTTVWRSDDPPDKLRADCEDGHVSSCGWLANRYEVGNGVDKDQHAAATLYERGCDLGDAGSCTTIGHRHFFGSEGVTKDERKGALLWDKGCAAGAKISCGNLGLAYMDGRGVTADKSKALVFLRLACWGDGGDGRSCYHAGNLERELGDTTYAATLFQRACTLGEKRGC